MEDEYTGFPVLIRLAITLLALLLLIPLSVFSAIPNFFFGFGDTTPDMTREAMGVGAVYMSLEEFENTEIDAMVTRIVSEYTEKGVEIDHIQVVSDFQEEDLLWFIAINSVAHEQNLEGMTAESIHQLCLSRLNYQSSLFSGETVTLVITISKLEPETWMERLDFDQEGRDWAKTLYETLVDSDALNRYAAEFRQFVPNYGGDTSYTGGVQHGDSFENEIDISRFVDPHTKNNLDLAEYALQAWENNWGYVWGTFGGVLTQSLLDYKAEQYPDGVGAYRDYIEAHYLNRRTADCIGLIKGYGWLDPERGTIRYGTNGMPDYNADQMFKAAKESGGEWGEMDDLPEIPGLILWKEGHTGVYVGGGYAVEAMSTTKGVGKTQVSGRGWEAWYKLPCITYIGG